MQMEEKRMKLKRPITDTKELLEIAFPLVSAITAAGASDGDIASVGAALIMLISEIERADGKEENGIPQPCGAAPFRQGGRRGDGAFHGRGEE